MTTTTETHTTRSKRKRLANRRTGPPPRPAQQPDGPLGVVLYRAGHPIAPGHLYGDRLHNGWRARASTGSKTPFWTAVAKRRRRAAQAKLTRRENQR